MRCGFRPHDGDRTTESMEGVWMGSWAVVKRGWTAKREGFRATRLTVGASNRLRMRRKLTGGLYTLKQHHTPSFIPFRERISPAHETRTERCDGRVRVWLCLERTTERTGGTQTDASFEKHVDEMQMMTWQSATRKQTMVNNWKTPSVLDSGCYTEHWPLLVRR